MRINDERYRRDLRRLNLAMRLIKHEARTSTIRECTGLGDDRIRRLYHSYLRPAGACTERHRGKSPRAVLRLMASPRLAADGAVFACFSRRLGVCESTPAPAGRYLLLSLTTAEALCEAFEMYQECVPEGRLSFEQALCLLRALWMRDEIAPGHCVGCGAFVLVDLLSLASPRCSACARSEASR